MSIRHLLAAASAAVVVATVPAVGAAAAGPGTSSGRQLGDPTHAVYGDQIIDLSSGWHGAGACIAFADHTECFRTEAEQDAAYPQYAGHPGEAAKASGGASALLSCTPSVKLYANPSFGGSSFTVAVANSWFNLTGFSIDNATSSFWVSGSCDSGLNEYANGAGWNYPGATTGGATAASMLSGWDNRISAVWIYQ
jgi:hypothetical protein